MKNSYLPLFLISQVAFAQTDSTKAAVEIQKFQKATLETYSHLKVAALGPRHAKHFTHEFFPVNLKFRIAATLRVSDKAKTIKMKTSSGTTVEYARYGILTFLIDGKPFQLPVYRSLSATDIINHKDLFIPFTDLTNGTLTYAAGRYIELPLPQSAHPFIIDFNQAFNPYCAYSNIYSCPVVPAENHLDIEILAGIKYSGRK